MSKIKLKEIANAIREKEGTTEPIVANDFANRIRAISGSEDLDAELNTQDGLLTNLETEINNLPLSSTELTASTDEEMEVLLIQENIGKVVKFIGTSDIYETDSYYLIGE